MKLFRILVPAIVQSWHVRLRFEVKAILLTVVILLLSVLPHTASAQPMGIIPKAGKPLPEIRLPSTDGKSVSTRDLHGKRFVLHVFASW